MALGSSILQDWPQPDTLAPLAEFSRWFCADRCFPRQHHRDLACEMPTHTSSRVARRSLCRAGFVWKPVRLVNPASYTSLTVRCRVPNPSVVKQIRAALASPEMKAIAEDPRLAVDDKSKKGVVVSINWVPKGEFDAGARAIADHLKKLGCDGLIYQLESGRPFADSR